MFSLSSAQAIIPPSPGVRPGRPSPRPPLHLDDRPSGLSGILHNPFAPHAFGLPTQNTSYRVLDSFIKAENGRDPLTPSPREEGGVPAPQLAGSQPAVLLSPPPNLDSHLFETLQTRQYEIKQPQNQRNSSVVKSFRRHILRLSAPPPLFSAVSPKYVHRRTWIRIRDPLYPPTIAFLKYLC